MLEDVKFSLFLLLILLVVKTIVAAISLDCGLIGGIFAQAIFFGASLGSAYGKILGIVSGINTVIAGASPYSMVGMEAVFASSAKASLTSILLMGKIP